jgi:hypothetical protein
MLTEDSPISSAAPAANNARFMAFAPQKKQRIRPRSRTRWSNLRRPAKPSLT